MAGRPIYYAVQLTRVMMATKAGRSLAFTSLFAAESLVSQRQWRTKRGASHRQHPVLFDVHPFITGYRLDKTRSIFFYLQGYSVITQVSEKRCDIYFLYDFIGKDTLCKKLPALLPLHPNIHIMGKHSWIVALKPQVPSGFIMV